ncbi:MAG: lipid-A-disaccharide synthase [Calditrichaeota bacterium]|nr:lipid-A-disaccharide synthase [Calditrichota bacterium]
MQTQEIVIIAGELSGDIHAAPVVVEMKQQNPDLAFTGTRGPQMQNAGVELMADLDELAVMGFSGIVRMLPRLTRLKKSILEFVKSHKVKLVILVDYPGFNLNLAEALKKLESPPKILYYIAPQVWAWRAGRVKQIRRVVDRLAVVFPFEFDIFRKADVNIEFVGHPLTDELREYSSNTHDENGGTKLLALLPGSREQEIRRHLPVMIEAAEFLLEKDDSISLGLGCAAEISPELYRSYVRGHDKISFFHDSRQLLAQASVATVCSGTATLEAALLMVPQVVVYRTSALNYMLAKRLVRLKNIALVNVTAGKEIVPELIQQRLTAQNLANSLYEILSSSQKQSEIIKGYEAVKESLGEGGAAVKVAELALGMVI